VTEDPLDRILRAALDEKALGPGTLDRFARALKDRAAVVLAERVRPLEERAAALEKENEWRAGIISGLEAEIAWRRSVVDGLEKENAWLAETVRGLEEEKAWRTRENEGLRNENAWRTARIRDLEEEVSAVRAEKVKASAAHDALLAHHAAVLRGVLEVLAALPPDLPWRFRRARARIQDLALRLRREIG
jgi:chromosome segregation ATPase